MNCKSKSTLSVVFFCLVIVSVGKGQRQFELKWATRIDSFYQSIKGISFTFRAKKLYFMDNDTVTLEGQCSLIKKEGDSLGYWVNIHQNNGQNVIYNGKQIMWMDEEKKTINVYDVKKDGYTNFTGNSIVFIIPDLIKDRHLLQPFRNANMNSNVLRAEIVESRYAIDINTSFKPMDIIKKSTYAISLDRNTLFPRRTISYAEMDKFKQYMEYTFDNVTLSECDSTYFFISEKQQQQYKVIVKTKAADVSLLNVGELAPSWQLADLQGKIIELASLRGKIVVLDFWYMSCFPCLKMTPVLNEIDSLYKSRDIAVLGLNVYDSNHSKVQAFADGRINYPILMDALRVANMYHASGYPTIYIIDRNGRIVYADAGYSKDSGEKIKAIISQIK